MFPYTNRLADVTAQFPTTVMTPQDVRNLNEAGTLLNESGTVPALVDVEGKRRLNLDQVPVEQAGMDIRVATALRSLIPWGGSAGDWSGGGGYGDRCAGVQCGGCGACGDG